MSLKEQLQRKQVLVPNKALKPLPVVVDKKLTPSDAHKRKPNGTFQKGFNARTAKHNSVAALIREELGQNDEEGVAFRLAVMRGELEIPETRFDSLGEPYEVVVRPSIGQMSESQSWLHVHGWGKPPDKLEITSTHREEHVVDISKLTPEQARTLFALSRSIAMETSPRELEPPPASVIIDVAPSNRADPLPVDVGADPQPELDGPTGSVTG